MKFVVVFLIVATFGIAAINSAPQARDASSASATGSTPDIAAAINDMMIAFKHMVPCGDGALNLPPMAPLRLPIVSLDINHELLVLNGSISNFVLTGLKDFIVIQLNTNATSNRTAYDILYKDIQFLGDYNLYVNADLAGYKFIVNLQGLVNLQLKDIRVNGGITIGTNTAGGVLISDVDMYVQVGDIVSHILDTQWTVALNDFFNRQVRDAALIWLQTRREFLNQVLSKYVTETVNSALYNMSLSQCIQQVESIAQEWNALTCTTV